MRPQIRPLLEDNTLTPECAVLVSSIMASYEIDWVSLIIEQINEPVLKRSTSNPFPCLIYRLCIDSRVESLH